MLSLDSQRTFCMERKNFVMRIKILAELLTIFIAEYKVWRNFCGKVLEAKGVY
nr:unnamed protein product [Callosobruchus analis]